MKFMRKSQLVAAVANLSKLSKKDAERALDATFEAIQEALLKGDQIRVLGFGTFSTLQRKEKKGRNPRTQAPMVIPAARLPKFKPGKRFKELLA